MTVHQIPELKTEELLDMAMSNWHGLLFASIDFLKESKIQLPLYVQHVGKRFAPLWGTGLNAYQVAQGMAHNWLSVGAKIEALEGDENEARFVMTGYPIQHYLAHHGLSPEEADLFIAVAGPIAEHQGCSFSMERAGEQVTCTFTRKG